MLRTGIQPVRIQHVIRHKPVKEASKITLYVNFSVFTLKKKIKKKIKAYLKMLFFISKSFSHMKSGGEGSVSPAIQKWWV